MWVAAAACCLKNPAAPAAAATQLVTAEHKKNTADIGLQDSTEDSTTAKLVITTSRTHEDST